MRLPDCPNTPADNTPCVFSGLPGCQTDHSDDLTDGEYLSGTLCDSGWLTFKPETGTTGLAVAAARWADAIGVRPMVAIGYVSADGNLTDPIELHPKIARVLAAALFGLADRAEGVR